MNTHGDIVGQISNPNYPPGAYLFDRKQQLTALIIEGQRLVGASDINENGDIIGGYVDPTTGRTRGYIRAHDGTVTTFDAAPNSRTAPHAINERGDVVGNWNPIPLAFPGFFRNRNGELTVFYAPNASRTNVLDINNRGDVVGSFVDNNGSLHGFIRTKQ
jgi:uncharacterized membrane protein